MITFAGFIVCFFIGFLLGTCTAGGNSDCGRRGRDARCGCTGCRNCEYPYGCGSCPSSSRRRAT